MSGWREAQGVEYTSMVLGADERLHVVSWCALSSAAGTLDRLLQLHASGWQENSRTVRNRCKLEGCSRRGFGGVGALGVHATMIFPTECGFFDWNV